MTTQVVELPPPRANSPMLTRVITDPLLGEENPNPWVLGKQAPYLPPGWLIRRMFADDSSIEMYATSPDGRYFIRHLVPIARVRMIEESMSQDVFVDEIAVAEADDDDDEEDEDPEPSPDANAVASNGQAET
jgi:hypothetical protein